ncbi:hypothetical protein Goklo_012272 [Gossypium klotzschianum]|uniref:Uncharacterized protein n=1 Tax=Gossypium klotzschianum TaxID=34286 RepID=A0A7J8VCF8_9ROSI|nr:hypothetical protein [Gossypium klotzschianum]
MAEAESFIELDPRKEKFESSKPKETCNGGRDHKEDGNGNGGNEQSKISGMSKENEAEPVEFETLKLGSVILKSAKVKRDRKQKGLMYVDINITGQRKSVLINTELSDLFIFEKVMGKLHLSVSKSTKKIKIVNSKEVPIVGVEQKVSRDTRDGTKVLLVIQLAKDVPCGWDIDLVYDSATKTPLEMLYG